MGRSSVRRHKREILVDKVFFHSAHNMTHKFTSVFVGKRQLISDNQLRMHEKIISEESPQQNTEIVKTESIKTQELKSSCN